MKKETLKFLLPYFSILLSVLALVVLMFFSSIPIITGDGYQHYFIAEQAVTQPIYYLSHWGKPIFTLFASPFTFFGIYGVIIYNFILYILTCWVGIACLRHLKVHYVFQVLFPWVLVLTPDYSKVILSGLTEVTAGFMLILSLYFLLKKKWIGMALIISFLPFCRSEGMLIVILGAFVMIYNKQYKTLPLLLSGLFIYACIGYFSIDNFWWYFTDNPYPKASIYGHGEWNHFWVSQISYLGVLGMALTYLGFLALVYILFRWKAISFRLDVIAYGLISFFGILLVHAYLWKYGLRGSMGLTRVMVFPLPLLIIILMSLVQQFKISKKTIRYGLISFLFIGFITIAVSGFKFQFISKAWSQVYSKLKKENQIENGIEQAAKVIKSKDVQLENVYYFHPKFAYMFNVNPLGYNPIYHQHYFQGQEENFQSINYNDYIVWDSHFGPKDMRLPLAKINADSSMLLIESFSYTSSSGGFHKPWKVKVFQKRAKKGQPLHNKAVPLQLKNKKYQIEASNLYTTVLSNYKVAHTASAIQIKLKAANNVGQLVCDINNGEDWKSKSIQAGSNPSLDFPVQKGNIIKLYFYNPAKKTNTITIKNIEWKK